MAMLACPECHASVWAKAPSCPHCGRAMSAHQQHAYDRAARVAAVGVLLLVASFAMQAGGLPAGAAVVGGGLVLYGLSGIVRAGTAMRDRHDRLLGTLFAELGPDESDLPPESEIAD